MITEIIISAAVVAFASVGLAPTISTEPPSFGVLSCSGDCRELHAPGTVALKREIELGVLEGELSAPSKPCGEYPNSS